MLGRPQSTFADTSPVQPLRSPRHSRPILPCTHCQMACNYKAVVSYDGTNYHGFQMQAGKHAAPTIQGELEKCLLKILQTDRESLKLHGAGRTDRGVHARGQVISFLCNKTSAQEQLHTSLNAMLPDDIRIASVDAVTLDFSARHSAVGKEYHFHLDNNAVHDPICRSYRQHVHVPLDRAAMRHAAQLFLGRHDFTYFASVFPSAVDPYKTLTRCDVLEISPGQLRFEIQGSGFLYRMCRHMVGALVAVGKGLLDGGEISEMLAMGSGQPLGEKHRGWACAEARGLFLERVDYPPLS